ncbi:hypothetical protein [Faecalispora anaeroviscerum]|uniref:hypothetical protein n=1 Tax=Faecalispora anaeroviscerum TaxID=2991836 RepID=UPI0024BAB2E1|nr:hypothetical protein [Faecalispora anaeroviscerum]
MAQKNSALTAATVQSAKTLEHNQNTANPAKTQAPMSLGERIQIERMVREAYMDGKSGTATDFYTLSDEEYLTQFQEVNAFNLTGAAQRYIILLRRALQSAYEAGCRSALKEVSA